MVRGWKNERIEKYFNFSSFCLIGSGKVERWKKMSLYKFNLYTLVKK